MTKTSGGFGCCLLNFQLFQYFSGRSSDLCRAIFRKHVSVGAVATTYLAGLICGSGIVMDILNAPITRDAAESSQSPPSPTPATQPNFALAPHYPPHRQLGRAHSYAPMYSPASTSRNTPAAQPRDRDGQSLCFILKVRTAANKM